MPNLADLYTLCSASQQVGGATQEQLDEIGLLLDRLEECEIYLDSEPTLSDRKDTTAEMESLMTRIDLLMTHL